MMVGTKIKKTASFCFVLCLGIGIANLRGAEQAIDVLIFSGANNHNWQATTPELERILRRDPRFRIETTEDPDHVTTATLADYDVIVSNWNNFGKSELIWSETMRQALLGFVRGGGGHVVVHAGGSSYNNWQAYHQIAAHWGKDTHHGPRHEFTVQPTDVQHAITAGMTSFEIHDELWRNTAFPSESIMLLTASSKKDGSKDEPVLAVNSFGQGRCVNLMLGHDVTAMQNDGFATVFKRSVAWAGAGHSKETAYRLKQTERSIALLHRDKVVWKFNHGQDLTKPYFHPLALTHGTVLTWEAPPDHPWHYGLWFSWKFINGLNYWEEDRQTGKSEGTTAWENVVVVTHPDNAAMMTMDLSYYPPGKPEVLSERRTMKVSAPDKDGTYRIDWQSTFTAEAETVVLDRTPLPEEPGGKSWGGYAGLSFRACQGVEASRFISPQGPETAGKGMRRTAVEYAGHVQGEEFGVTILDHPQNLNAPTPWYLSRGGVMEYFSPAVICAGPHRLARGQTLTLRYRVIIHPDHWDAETLQEKHAQFLTESAF